MIFPVDIQAQFSAVDTPLPIYRDWAFDFETMSLATRGGKNYMVEGAEALKFWIYNALATVRGAYHAYSGNFGNDAKKLIGHVDTSQLDFLIEEALTCNPYITGVSGFVTGKDSDRAIQSFTVHTLYGDIGGTFVYGYI